MPSPFPGMDPYLEDSGIWPGFHHNLAGEIQGQLNLRLSRRYYADVDVRAVSDELGSISHAIYPDVGVSVEHKTVSDAAVAYDATRSGIPPAPVRRVVALPYQTKMYAVRIYQTGTGELVTSIEILSPVNKHGDGLVKYQRKRARLLQSWVHVVEIDLLRGGERPGPEVADPPLDADYVLLVNRAGDDDERVSEIWPASIREALPILPIPLLRPDPDVPLDLNAAIGAVYVRAVYDRRIDYRAPVPAP